jgi:MFS transporter, ACDE family, multidrug resistance protein
MESKTKLTLAIILISSTFTVMAGAIIGPVVNLIREGVNVDQSMAGLIVTTHGLFVAGLSPVWGLIIDKIGTKKPYILGLLVYGIAGGSGLFIDSYWVLIVSRAVFGIGVAAVFTSITVMILNLYKNEERDKVMGWRGSGNSISASVWPLIGGGLGLLSWHLPFGIYLLGIPLGILAVFYVPTIKPTEKRNDDKKISLRMIFADKPILFGIYAFMFLTNFFLYTNVVYMPRILEKFGLTNSFFISLFLAAMGISAGITAAFYHRVKTYFKYKQIVLISLFFWTVSFVVAKFSINTTFVALSVILYGVGQGLALPTGLVWIGDVVSRQFYGRISSYLATFGYLGQFAAPVFFAPVLTSFGIKNIFLTAGILSMILLILLIINISRVKGKRKF